mmetsp:Transcript_64433/g.153734  ORF Transcript_64433/g.153734 Transcript_64433/m.153734 type:complete len:465 (+) Transcript_64433:148-1542(+)
MALNLKTFVFGLRMFLLVVGIILAITSTYSCGSYELKLACNNYFEHTLAHYVRNRCESGAQYDGELVVLKCPYREFFPERIHGWGPFAGVSTQALGLRTEVYMLQCEERCKSPEDSKWHPPVGHLPREEVQEWSGPECKYALGWRPYPIDMAGFRDPPEAERVCGVTENPTWPMLDQDVPAPKTVYADLHKMEVGGFKLNSGTRIEATVPTEALLDEKWADPPGWTRVEREYGDETRSYTNHFKQVDPSTGLGTVHVKFFKEAAKDVSDVTIVGKNENGTIVGWTAPWPCTGYYFDDLRLPAYDPNGGDGPFVVLPEKFVQRWTGLEKQYYVRVFYIVWMWAAWSCLAGSSCEIPGWIPRAEGEDQVVLCLAVSGAVPAVALLALMVECAEYLVAGMVAGMWLALFLLFTFVLLGAMTLCQYKLSGKFPRVVGRRSPTWAYEQQQGLLSQEQDMAKMRSSAGNI